MQKIVIDGKEYILVPKEQLQPVETPVVESTETTQDDQHGVLQDFFDESPVSTPIDPLDDGLATNAEKQNAIRVVESPQDIEVAAIPNVPKAQPKPYAYRERFIKKELLPSDVMTFSRISQEFLDSNPEDPLIKADQKKPKSKQFFYGPATQQEGY